jgi:hypothetical protein
MKTYIKAIIFLAITLYANKTFACDPCALYNSFRLQGYSGGAFSLSLNEQSTNFEPTNKQKENSLRDGQITRSSSTTQLAAAYDITDCLSTQLTLPLITRHFDKYEKFRRDSETETGLGDIILSSSYSLLNYKSDSFVFLGAVTGGIKFPTGDTGTLNDLSSSDIGDGKLFNFKHHQIETSSANGALNFGSGSYDYILGSDIIARYNRFAILLDAQYTLRTEGDHNYEFADDLIYSASAGYYFIMEHSQTLAALVRVSGEYKRKDYLNGDLVDGSATSDLYLGPELLFTLNENLGGEVGVDFKVNDHEYGALIEPETRMRISLTYRFL